MRWLDTEYILKGVYLGLVLYVALQLGATPPDAWTSLAQVNLLAAAGLAAALLAAAALKMRQGYRPRGRPLVFILFLLLECPALVYAGILGGTLLGTIQIRQPGLGDLLLPTVGGGAAVGVVFGLLRQVRQRRTRFGLILLLAAGLMVGALVWLGRIGELGQHGPHLKDPIIAAVQLLIGVPFFYILTFAGRREETEVEIGALCAVLGLGLTILTGDLLQFKMLGFVVPLVLYFWYTTRLLTAVRVLKHVFRGLSFARGGRTRQALQAFRRALELDPKSQMAKSGYWDLHRSLDVQQLAHDPETLALVDLELCVQRVSELLLSVKPTTDQLDEANRLLDLVLKLRPDMGPPVDYWRAVANTHAKQFDAAAAALARVLNPDHFGPDNPRRRAVLLQAWQLALTLHNELRRRVGDAELAIPGRRMEAIAAVERHLAANPEDQTVWGLKRMLYHDLSEPEFNEKRGRSSFADAPFDFGYVEQLGLALIEDNTRWQRGAEYLRMAAHGQPLAAPRIQVQIAKAYQRAGLENDARTAFEAARDAGRAAGAKNLPDPERQAYFATVKYLGDLALHHDDVDAALENYTLYSESERAGLETLRILAGLHERKGDAITALRITDRALIYDAKDKDLLERKDRYYYSVMPEQLQARLDQVKAGFDLEYCLRKARTILDGRQYEGLEWLDVAQHLTQLALVVKPESLVAKVLLARCRLRYGERDEAMLLLEQVHAPKPEKFASTEEEDAWYQCCQILGDLYLETSRADLAVPCLHEFRKSTKSGARTLFKLAQAYEQLGDTARAKKHYEQVTAYEGNPLTYEAQDALSRLQAG